jgi:hypothetical protein
MARGGARVRSGPAKKPKELKVLEGTFRTDRDGGTPIATVGDFPTAPDYLNDRQRELWAELERHCGAWVGTSDKLAVLGAVSIFDMILRNIDAQNATPDSCAMLTSKVFMDEKGGGAAEAKESPLITQQIKLWRELRGYLAILGLSPADRARVQVKETHGKSGSKWAGILTEAR